MFKNKTKHTYKNDKQAKRDVSVHPHNMFIYYVFLFSINSVAFNISLVFVAFQ